jgi:hypothetical protein
LNFQQASLGGFAFGSLILVWCVKRCRRFDQHFELALTSLVIDRANFDHQQRKQIAQQILAQQATADEDVASTTGK